MGLWRGKTPNSKCKRERGRLTIKKVRLPAALQRCKLKKLNLIGKTPSHAIVDETARVATATKKTQVCVLDSKEFIRAVLNRYVDSFAKTWDLAGLAAVFFLRCLRFVQSVSDLTFLIGLVLDGIEGELVSCLCNVVGCRCAV